MVVSPIQIVASSLAAMGTFSKRGGRDQSRRNMSEYHAQFRREVIVRSQANVFEQACTEWDIVSVKRDRGSPETCVCGKEGIIDQVSVANRVTGAAMLIDKDCAKHIENYAVKLMDDVLRVEQGKLPSPALVKHLHSRGLLTNWEEQFLGDRWRKRKATERQQVHQDRLLTKIGQTVLGGVVVSGLVLVDGERVMFRVGASRLEPHGDVEATKAAACLESFAAKRYGARPNREFIAVCRRLGGILDDPAELTFLEAMTSQLTLTCGERQMLNGIMAKALRNITPRADPAAN